MQLRDQARPNSVDRYRVPALSTTAIVEPFEAMQPVSVLPFVHVGSDRPTINSSLGRKGIRRCGDKDIAARERYGRAVRCVEARNHLETVGQRIPPVRDYTATQRRTCRSETLPWSALVQTQVNREFGWAPPG
jgi:hypothetical protein